MAETDIVYELPPFFLNQSRYKNYQDCARYYGWLHIENLVPVRPRKQLVIGTAIHAAQVSIYGKGGSQESILEATQVAVDFVKKQLPTSIIAIPGTEDLEEKSEQKESVDTVQKMIPAYHAHWGELGQLWKPLGQELAFCVEVGVGTGVYLVGRVDNLAIFARGLWIIDYKTMKAMKMQEFLKYQIDIQLTAYLYGGSKQLALDAAREGKKPVTISGAIIDGLIKTSTPQFHREFYTRTNEEMHEFEKEFCFTAWDLAAKHALVDGNRILYDAYREKMWELGREAGWKVVFPKSTNHCFQYGACTHRDLCIKDNDTRRLAFLPRTLDYVDARRTK